MAACRNRRHPRSPATLAVVPRPLPTAKPISRSWVDRDGILTRNQDGECPCGEKFGKKLGYVSGQRSEVSGQWSGFRGQRSAVGVRSQYSEVRGHGSVEGPRLFLVRGAHRGGEGRETVGRSVREVRRPAPSGVVRRQLFFRGCYWFGGLRTGGEGSEPCRSFRGRDRETCAERDLRPAQPVVRLKLRLFLVRGASRRVRCVKRKCSRNYSARRLPTQSPSSRRVNPAPRSSRRPW